MKNFEMPVVVLNEMAMNESIASDCCYSQVTSGLVTTKTVLNGGSIGDYVTWPLTDVAYEWVMTFGQIPNYHYNAYYYDGTGVNVDGMPKDGSGVVSSTCFVDKGKVVAFTSIIGATAYPGQVMQYVLKDGTVKTLDPTKNEWAYVVRTMNNCNHANSDCPFVKKTTLGNAHIGATVRHIFGGSDWMAPHTAQQYNS